MKSLQFLLTAGLAFAPLPLLAQETTVPADEWRQSLIIYLLAPTIDGKVGVGRFDGDLSIDPGTVLDTLDGAFLGAWMAERGNLGVVVDAVYMDLEQDISGPGGHATGTLGLTQLILGASASLRLSETAQLLVGGRYVDLENDVELSLPASQLQLSVTESWFDPTIGVRIADQLNERWSYGVVADIGGFGLGSDLTWQLSGSFAYRFGEHMHGLLGLRYIDFDYEDGSGPERFKFDVAQYGPVFGLRWDF